VPSSVWEGVGKQLGRDHRVFTLDLPPFGYSQRRGSYTLRGWVDLVRGFDQHLGVHRPILVGHSLGAAVVVTHQFLENWERPFEVQGTLDALRSMLQYGIQGFHPTQLHAVRVPGLVLWGAKDTVDPVSAGRKSARALHARFELLPRAGHLSMLGEPKAITAAVDAFARRRGARP
jgi:pimeloyl-ACP methyl ester carboxylesterase